MKRLIFATHNPGKIEEMRQLVADLGMDVLSADEAGVHEDVEEDGTTFAENAFKKARFVASKTGEWAVADDSGIMIDALAGRPGVYTARWAGEGASDEELVRHTLEQLKDVEEGKRGASFHSSRLGRQRGRNMFSRGLWKERWFLNHVGHIDRSFRMMFYFVRSDKIVRSQRCRTNKKTP